MDLNSIGFSFLLVFIRCYSSFVVFSLFRTLLTQSGVVALSLAVSIGLFPLAWAGQQGASGGSADIVGLLLLLGAQVVIGVCQALPFAFSLEVFSMWGHLVDSTRGAQFAEQVSAQENRTSTLENIAGIGALYLAFSSGAYQYFFRALADSFQFISLSTAAPDFLAITRAATLTLFTAVGLAAPVIIAVLALDIVFGLLGSTLSRLQIGAELMPLRLILGLFFAALCVLEFSPGLLPKTFQQRFIGYERDQAF
jgi:flagellar biosynthetic protein FliR